jgi:hypothetical protein
LRLRRGRITKKVTFICYRIKEARGSGNIGGIGGLNMWKVIALLGFLSTGDANLFYSVQEYPTKATCTKAIPIFQKYITEIVKTHINGTKVATAFSCILSEDAYKPEAPPVEKKDLGTPA